MAKRTVSRRAKTPSRATKTSTSKRKTPSRTTKTPTRGSKTTVNKKRVIRSKRIFYNPKTLIEIKRGGKVYNEVKEKYGRVPTTTKENLVYLRSVKNEIKRQMKQRQFAKRPTKYELANRGVDMKQIGQIAKGLVKDPLVKQVFNSAMDMILSYAQVNFSGVLEAVTFGLGGDTISDVVFAVIDTVMSGLDTLLGAPELLTRATGVDFTREYLPFNENIEQLREMYKEKWRSGMIDLEPIRNNLASIMKNVAQLIATWISTISGWMSVLVPDDAGLISATLKNVTNIATTAILSVPDGKLIEIFSKLGSVLNNAFIKVAQFSDKRMEFLNQVQNINFSKYESKLKILSQKQKRIVLDVLSSSDESNFVNANYSSNIQKSTTWLAMKAAKMFDESVKEVNDRKFVGMLVPKSLVQFSNNIKNRAPDAVNAAFVVVSLIIGILSLFEVAREPVQSSQSESDSNMSDN